MTTLVCESCGHALDELSALVQCPACGGLLAVRHQAPQLSGTALRDLFTQREADSGVWRFVEMVLPGTTKPVSFPEGRTPLLRRSRLAAYAGIEDVAFKHEGMNPTGSFKDRGMTVGMTQAVRCGAKAVACASTGNTSASLAAYAALAGLPAYVLVPAGKIAMGKLAQAVGFGARSWRCGATSTPA